MTEKKRKIKPWLKWLLTGVVVCILVAAVAIYYIFTETYSDTAALKQDFTLNARDLIKDFQQNDSLANRKYAEKIILVKGVVTEQEPSDTTMNIKMADTASGAYIIFAFQKQHLAEARKIKEGDSVGIKGSCSGGAYSSILEAEYITFKRSVISK